MSRLTLKKEKSKIAAVAAAFFHFAFVTTQVCCGAQAQ
jgi:hypothetical protein